MSAPIWEGRGQLEGWKVAMMGGRPVARFNGRLVGAANQPPAVRARVKAASPEAAKRDAPAKREAKPKKAACACPTRTPAGPAATLLPRASRKARLFVWFAPARKPNAKRGGGLRYVGGWPDDNATAAMAAAAKAKRLPAGILYICDEALNVLKTAAKAKE